MSFLDTMRAGFMANRARQPGAQGVGRPMMGGMAPGMMGRGLPPQAQGLAMQAQGAQQAPSGPGQAMMAAQAPSVAAPAQGYSMDEILGNGPTPSQQAQQAMMQRRLGGLGGAMMG